MFHVKIVLHIFLFLFSVFNSSTGNYAYPHENGRRLIYLFTFSCLFIWNVLHQIQGNSSQTYLKAIKMKPDLNLASKFPICLLGGM